MTAPMPDARPGQNLRLPIPLRDLPDLDLAEEVAAVLKQVERPRVNLGGSAPPGRAD